MTYTEEMKKLSNALNNMQIVITDTLSVNLVLVGSTITSNISNSHFPIIHARNSETSEVYGTLTTYAEFPIMENHILVKLYNENETWANKIIESEQWLNKFEFVKTYLLGPYDAHCEIWKLNEINMDSFIYIPADIIRNSK